MTQYRITNTISGQDIGTYEASDEQGALNAMAREGGYRDHAHCCEIAAVRTGELQVAETEKDDTKWGLYDSETNEPLTPDDIGCSNLEYDRAVDESRESDPADHVYCAGRRVYAST